MSNTLYITVISFMILLSGCPTPAGKLTDSDFLSRTIFIESDVAHSLTAFYDGVRYCGPTSGIITGITECAPMRPDGSAICDMYLPGTFGGRSDWVLGKVELRPKHEGTSAKLSIQSFRLWTGKEKTLDAWEMFLRGKAQSVCP